MNNFRDCGYKRSTCLPGSFLAVYMYMYSWTVLKNKWVFLVLAFTLLWQQLRQNPASKASQKGHRNRCCLKNKMTVRFYICWTFSWLFIYPTAKIAENQKRPSWIGRERICWAIIICPWVRLRVAYKQKTHTKCKNILLTSVHRRLWVGKFVFCSINPNESLRPKKRVSQIGNIIESKENGFSSLEKGTLFRKPWRRMKKSWLACKIHICTKDALFASHCSCGKTF